MGSFSITHWVIVAIVILVLFGRGKISETMGDFGKGMRSFKRGLSDDEPAQLPPAQSDATPRTTAAEAEPTGADRR